MKPTERPSKWAWRSDFGICVTELSSLPPGVGSQLGLAGAHAQKYRNKTVTWNLAFRAVTPNGDTTSLEFDLEPFGIKPGSGRSGKPVFVFKAAAGSADDWKGLSAGDQVDVSGVVSSVAFMTMGDRSGSVDFAIVNIDVVSALLTGRGSKSKTGGEETEQPVPEEKTPASKMREECIAAIVKLGGSVAHDPQFVVNLNGHQVTDEVMVYLNGLTEIDELNLHYTGVTDAGLMHLKALPGLEKLDLLGAGFTDAGLVHLKSLGGLEKLILVGGGFTDAGMVHLKSLTGLERLSLGDNKVTDGGLVYLEGLTNLKFLQLIYSNSFNEITDAGLVHLKGLEKLEELMLDGTHVTGAGLTYLAGLKRLSNLRLTRTDIADEGLG